MMRAVRRYKASVTNEEIFFMVRVRTDITANPPAASGDIAVGQPDPTIISGAQDTYVEGSPESGRTSPTAPISNRTWTGEGDPVLRRHMTEVLMRALGMSLFPSDKPE